MVEAWDADSALQILSKKILEEGIVCSPRGMETKELLNVSMCLKRPLGRIIRNTQRGISLPFAFGEFLWMMKGTNDVNMINWYNKRMIKYSDDKETLYGAYGPRIKETIEQVKSKLDKDSDTRQAIIPIIRPKDLFRDTKDFPCTLSLQFLIRDEKLHAVLNMRSNDIMWGFPYDIFSFTMIQEHISLYCGTELGYYYHNVGSMHIYEQHYEAAKRIHEQKSVRTLHCPKMTDMPDEIFEVEEKIRKGEDPGWPFDDYWNSVLSILKGHCNLRMKEDKMKTLSDKDNVFLIFHESSYKEKRKYTKRKK